MSTSTVRLTPPEEDQKRHRMFDLVVLPTLALITIFLIALAMMG